MDFKVVITELAHIADLAHHLIVSHTYDIFSLLKYPIYTEGKQAALGPFPPKTIKDFWG